MGFTSRITVLALLLISLPLSAEALLEWEDICYADVCRATGHDGVMAAELSPFGDELVVTVKTRRQEGLYRVLVGDGEPRFLVEGSSPVWLPDGESIVFIRDEALWRIGRDSDQATRLTPAMPGLRAPRPSPDGERIAFYSTRSGHQDLWLVAADGGDEPRPLTDGSMTKEEIRLGHAWSPDGESIAYFSNQADYWHDDLWLVDVATGDTRQLSTGLMGRNEPSWSPDGTRIAVIGSEKGGVWYGDLADIFLVDVESGNETRLDMPEKAMSRLGVNWGAGGDELFFANHQRGEIEWWRVPATGGVATRVSNMGGMIHSVDTSAGADGFAFVRSTPERGREVDYLSIEGGQAQTLTDFATDWPGLVTPREISYRSFDGHYIQAFMFTPPDFDPEGDYPILVQVHGGGTNSYFNGLNLVEQRLAQRGFVVLAVNYRGGSGFGRAFQDMAINDWANDQALDAAAAADFIRARAWSSGKVGIYGYSYGGIISLAAVTRAPEAFDAAVPMAGIYDFADAYSTADRLGRIFTATGHGGAPSARPEVYAASNSVRLLDQVETPILLMHGEADARAPYRQFEMVVEGLEEHDKTFESHSYPGEPHRFRQLENRIDLYQRLEAWMDRWLR